MTIPVYVMVLSHKPRLKGHQLRESNKHRELDEVFCKHVACLLILYIWVSTFPREIYLDWHVVLAIVHIYIFLIQPMGTEGFLRLAYVKLPAETVDYEISINHYLAKYKR